MGGELTKALPHNLDAERALLGAVLLDNVALDRAVEAGIFAEVFFLTQHVRIFDAMLRLSARPSTAAHSARTPIDLITLTEELHRRSELEAAGGTAYVSSLVDGVPAITNVEHYAAIVRDKWLKRQLAHTGQATVQRALADDAPAGEMLEQAEREVFALAEQRIRAALVGMPEVMSERVQFMDRLLVGNGGITGLPTGYADVDELTAGLHPGELVILAARPGIGKTALAVNIAHNVVMGASDAGEGKGGNGGQPVALFSLEMSKEAIGNRMLSWEARVDSWKFRKGWFAQADVLALRDAAVRLAGAPLWIDDAGTATVMEIASKARRMKREHGLALVIVDYLQLVAPPAGVQRRSGTRNEEVGAVSRGLKALAKELSVPVMALSQLTRGPEKDKRRPVLADLRDSGEVEQDADVVLFIHRAHAFEAGADEERRGETELIVAKQRNGPTETVEMRYLRELTRFERKAKR